MLCTGQPSSGGEATKPASMRAGVSYGAFWTTLVFSGDLRVPLREQAVTASFEYRPGPAVSLSAAAGAVLDGRIGDGALRHDIGPGFVGSMAGSWRLLGGSGGPFVMLSAGLAFSTLPTSRVVAEQTERPRLSALDIRGGLIAGATLLDRISPYGVVRAFGGPVWWSLPTGSITGTDAYHYQLGAGISVSLPRGIDLFAEGVPLGEKRASAGLGASF